MRYVFGPVPSRRLGQSLGIDPVPLKTCNWNCVYCQLGRTRPVVNVRAEYVPAEAVVDEVGRVLRRLDPTSCDWVTFVGSGEPLLHIRVGWLIRSVKDLTSKPVAVITNGALLYLDEVREEVAAADAVLPSIDAGNPDLYRRLNRPHPEASFDRLVEGLVSFRAIFKGELWAEVMLVNGMNDGAKELREIAAVLRLVRPDQIHLNLPSRPPAETWVRSQGEKGVVRAITIMEGVAPVWTAHPPAGAFDLSGSEEVGDAVVSIITRHPMRQSEIERSLARFTPGEVQATLQQLAAEGRAKVVRRNGVDYWTVAEAYFPSGNGATDEDEGDHAVL